MDHEPSSKFSQQQAAKRAWTSEFVALGTCHRHRPSATARATTPCQVPSAGPTPVVRRYGAPPPGRFGGPLTVDTSAPAGHTAPPFFWKGLLLWAKQRSATPPKKHGPNPPPTGFVLHAGQAVCAQHEGPVCSWKGAGLGRAYGPKTRTSSFPKTKKPKSTMMFTIQFKQKQKLQFLPSNVQRDYVSCCYGAYAFLGRRIG
jgi:hypothetical protein